MKKTVFRFVSVALSALCLIACLSGCVSSGDPDDTKPIVDDHGNKQTDGTQPSDTPNDESITISEQVLFDHDGVKATATAFKRDSIWGDGINILIENNSSADVGVGCNELIVNNYMISNLFSETVAAGKKSNKVLNLSASDLKAAGITTVGQIEAYFHLFNPETFMTTFECDPVTVKTSTFDKMTVSKQDGGVELLNKDGIRIVGKYVNENDIFGTAVVLFIENNTGKNVVIQCDDLSVNGFMISSMFSCTVFGGKMAVDDITLLSSSLEENNITSVDDIEVKFKVCDADTFNTIFETEAIKFSARSN